MNIRHPLTEGMSSIFYSKSDQRLQLGTTSKTCQAKARGDSADIVQHLLVIIGFVLAGWSTATIMHDPTTR